MVLSESWSIMKKLTEHKYQKGFLYTQIMQKKEKKKETLRFKK